MVGRHVGSASLAARMEPGSRQQFSTFCFILPELFGVQTLLEEGASGSCASFPVRQPVASSSLRVMGRGLARISHPSLPGVVKGEEHNENRQFWLHKPKATEHPLPWGGSA